MNSKFLSQFDNDNIGKTASYYVIAVSLIVISLLVGLTDNLLTITLLLGGIALFQYTLLRPWEKPAYYAIMSGICFILLITEFIVPPEFWQKQFKGWVEIAGMTAGFIFLAGIFAGIIGILRFRKYD